MDALQLAEMIITNGPLQKELAVADQDFDEAAMCRDAVDLAKLYKAMANKLAALEAEREAWKEREKIDVGGPGDKWRNELW